MDSFSCRATITVNENGRQYKTEPTSLLVTGDTISMYMKENQITFSKSADAYTPDISHFHLVCASTLDELSVKVNSNSSETESIIDGMIVRPGQPYQISSTTKNGFSWELKSGPVTMTLGDNFSKKDLISFYCAAATDLETVRISGAMGMQLNNKNGIPMLLLPGEIRLPDCWPGQASSVSFPATLYSSETPSASPSLSAKILTTEDTSPSDDIQITNERGENLSDGVNITLTPGQRTENNLTVQFNCNEPPGEHTWYAHLTLNVP
ncbi:hypothetical protein [Erwinia typographi]|uniref:hypothetical protein n=1 Tax=Erwinia typographi TaxID=371042 RepID=UPI0012EEA90B|nr:hypothetical protein [Erwinia typographi]